MFNKFIAILIGIICLLSFTACGNDEETAYTEYVDAAPDTETSGYSRYSWTLAIEPAFGFVTEFRDGIAAVRVGDWVEGHWGVIDTEGNFVIEPIYRQLGNAHMFHQGGFVEDISIEFFPVQLDDKWGIVDINGDEVIPFIYDEIFIFDNGLARVVVGSWEDEYRLHGLIDLRTGTEIVPLMHGFIQPPSEGLMEMRVGDWVGGHSGFIDESGTEIIPAMYHFVHNFVHGLAVVGFGGEWSTAIWGVIDKTGREIIPADYQAIQIFSENAIALSYGEWGIGPWKLVDRNGNEILPPMYASMSQISDELVMVTREAWDSDSQQTFGIVNFVTGEEVIPRGTFSAIHAIMNPSDQNYLTAVIIGTHPDNFSGVIDISTGEMVLEATYHQTFILNGNMIAVRYRGEWHDDWQTYIGEKWGIVDRFGQEIAPKEFGSLVPFGSDLVVVSTGGIPEFWDPTTSQWGLMNSSGDMVLPLEYTHIGHISEGLAVVNIGGEWVSWGGGGIEVNGGRWGFINESGDIVIPTEMEFDQIMALSEGMAAVRQGSDWGFIRIER